VKCPNCGENADGNCACIQNTCCSCGKPVGNVTFTVCDECWGAEHPNEKDQPPEVKP
jgi:hypothetical protein